MNVNKYDALLHEREQLFTALVENNPDLIARFDKALRHVYVNPAIEAASNIKKEDIIGKTNIEIGLPENLCSFWDNNHRKVFETGQEAIIEWSYGSPIRYYQTRIVPEFSKEGSVETVLAISRDITSLIIAEKELQLKTEEMLHESERKYRDLIENLPMGFAIISGDRYVYVNSALTTLTGHSKEELAKLSGSELLSFIHPEHRNDIRKRLDARLNGRPESNPYQFRLLNRDGSVAWVDGYSKVLEFGNRPSVQVIINDITERKKAEDALKEKERQLFQSKKLESIGNLAGGIAHDFNNILSSIIGFTELALDDVEEDSMIEDNLQEVYTAGKRAKGLVAQILAFARQSEEELKPIQVDIIIKEVLQFIRSSIPATIEIRKNIDSNSCIMGNRTQVYQIMMNLCTNAAYAMEDEGGTLNVTLKDIVVDESYSKNINLKPGNYIQLTVSDTGVGIPSDIIDSIFEPYFTTKDSGEGTGIGLAMVQGIIKSYGGKIIVNSSLGKGTNFTTYLPVTRKRKIQRQYIPEQLPKGTEKILFVDDEAPIAKMGSQGLESLGYKVTIRTSSVEALELFKSKPYEFDLVITDMTMLNITGEKLAIALMKIRPEIPIILCTGYSKKISNETASEIGIKAFAYKPIAKADLARTVRKVLDEAKSSS